MATITSVKSGNWSDPTVWNSGTVPVDGDTVVSANHTITLDVDITQPNTLLTSTGSSGRYRYDGTGTRTVAARANAGTHVVSGLIYNSGAGTLVFVGTMAGGSGANAYGAYNNATGTLTVTTVTGGNGNNAYGVFNNSTGTLTVTTATGGSGAAAYGAYNNATGTLTVTTVTGGSGNNAHGAYNNSTGTLTVDLAVGNNYGDGVTTYGTYGIYNAVSSNKVTVRKLQFGSHGFPPVFGRTYFEQSAGNNSCRLPLVAGGSLTVTDDGSSLDHPAIGDVRAGTVYKNGDLTGTCHVPTAGSVALGVAVDAGVGTAVLTAAAVGAQLETAIGATARPEPVAVPAANASFAAKLDWLYAFFRNKRVVDIDGATLRNDADTADIGTTAMSDAAGTFTQGKWQ